jgi:putative membrane protein
MDNARQSGKRWQSRMNAQSGSPGLEASRRRYLLGLCVLYLALWIPLAIAPKHRADWLLENALLVAGVAVLAISYRSLPLSRISYTTIFLFLCLHAVGAHYTYSEVPFGFMLSDWFGFERNHFDRIVHFSYGLLLAYPIREAFLRVANVRGFWGYFLPLDVTMSTSMLYELIEWAAAEFFGGELGVAYLGSQGDVWDAQKDMALATLGAAICMGATAIVNVRLNRDFARDWIESLRVKDPRPMGEEAIQRMQLEKASRD